MKYTLWILMGALMLGGCHKKDKTEDQIPDINVAEAMTDSVILSKEYPGYMEATSKVEVVGEVSGRLLARHFTPGTKVAKGQLLYTIESTTYRDQAQEAQSTLTSAKSQRDYYSQQVMAMQKAYEQQAVSRMELLQAQTSLRQAESQIAEASARLESANTLLSKCSVRAPISGYISADAVDPGNYINGQGDPVVLCTIYDNSVMRAVFSIDEGQYATMQMSDSLGNPMVYKNVTLNFTQPVAHKYVADLSYTSPSVDKSTGMLELRGKVANIDNELKDGMYVVVSLPYGVDPKAVVVKESAISTDQLGKYLYVVNDSNKVKYTPITLGPLYHDSLRVVEKGLRPGDKYVTQALLKVRNGMQVNPKLQK